MDTKTMAGIGIIAFLVLRSQSSGQGGGGVTSFMPSISLPSPLQNLSDAAGNIGEVAGGLTEVVEAVTDGTLKATDSIKQGVKDAVVATEAAKSVIGTPGGVVAGVSVLPSFKGLLHVKDVPVIGGILESVTGAKDFGETLGEQVVRRGTGTPRVHLTKKSTDIAKEFKDMMGHDYAHFIQKGTFGTVMADFRKRTGRA